MQLEKCVLPDMCNKHLLTLFLFILVVNQLDVQNLFYNKFISCLYMFRAPIGVMIPDAV